MTAKLHVETPIPGHFLKTQIPYKSQKPIVLQFTFQKLTDMKGVDIIVELGAHKMLEEDIKSLKKNGRIVVSSPQPNQNLYSIKIIHNLRFSACLSHISSVIYRRIATKLGWKGLERMQYTR